MHVQDDLLLIREQLYRLTETAYFENALNDHARDVIALIDHVAPRVDGMPDLIAYELRRQIWTDHQHLNGSTSNEIPYEIVHVLTRALRSWIDDRDVLVTTALLDEPAFYFTRGLRWPGIAKLLPEFEQPRRPYTLVQISLPRLYRTYPLRCAPLFHELAHYLDDTVNVSDEFILQARFTDVGPGRDLQRRYMREHFADLFSACYLGETIVHDIMRLNNVNGATRTHPDPSYRIEVVQAFLAGRTHRVVDQFNAILQERGLPSLHTRFALPDVAAAFDDIRPCSIASDQELYGIFPAAQAYLAEILEDRRPSWSDWSRQSANRTINDLVEKSIRNMDLKEKWRNAAMEQVGHTAQSELK
ncbi:hypothetical protein ACLNGM_17030 [Aureimonas phyllosphaerae]|uniref:hypothetical protein n=1 Tax=Aureimonas phyllosphaerae TaxID=1166078 RepID=UPI003A5BE128